MFMYQSNATLESCPFTENRAGQVSERASRKLGGRGGELVAFELARKHLNTRAIRAGV